MDTQQDMDATMQGKSIAGPVDVMIDLETNGLKPGCGIASIGATTFSPYLSAPRAYFHAFAKIPDERFTSDPKTLAWWNTQDPSLRAMVFGGWIKIDSVLMSFAEYLNHLGTVRVWGNAASFDLKILEKAYEICGLEVPWSYKNEMCYRTLKNLYPQVPYKKPRTSHDALEDAIAQANHADEILGFKAALELGYYNQVNKEIFNGTV